MSRFVNIAFMTLVGLILCQLPVTGQKAFKTGAGQPDAHTRTTFTANGKPFAKRQGISQVPKEVIDTVAIVAGRGSLKLKDTFSSNQHRVAPTASDRIYAHVSKVMSDSTDAVYSYSWYYDAGSAELNIRSSGGSADTGKVVVTCYVR